MFLKQYVVGYSSVFSILLSYQQRHRLDCVRGCIGDIDMRPHVPRNKWVHNIRHARRGKEVQSLIELGEGVLRW